MTQEVRQISQRMSLRKPQIEALETFAKAIDFLPMRLEKDLDQILNSLRAQFPQVSGFEREFPNLCFALATGVGKTRLLGAMITYLSRVHGIRDFLILAPNNTILEKLVREFSNPNDSKYVFRGIAEFATQTPKIITSKNYDEGYGVRNKWSKMWDFFKGDEVHINIFSIAMIHANDRRMKDPREMIEGGLSYFEYLVKLEKLVVFMDEAHRYRAKSASEAINDLNAILGVELTATPQIEASGRFKNIIYEYPLSSALKDGFVKEPWVAGRENYQPEQYSDEALERLKLEDGVRIHESTKIHLQNYAYLKGKSIIKPFILVITENMAHANRIETFIKGDDFFEGKYAQKVRVVHSSVKADDEERMVKDLLEIESHHNPIEIVIHVNMLKEGWDVQNLYTIIPLRAANSKTLIEQSLGRGLRLPFGERTGVLEVDRLTIVSHDRFDEIVKEANRPDSLIKAGILIGRDLPLNGFRNIEVKPVVLEEMKFLNDSDRLIVEKAFEVHAESGDKAKTLSAIEEQFGRAAKETAKIAMDRHEAFTIRIPRIHIEPVEVKPGRYLRFKLNLNTISPQPISEAIIEQNLQDGTRRKIDAGVAGLIEGPLENYIASALLDYPDIAEANENIEILLDIAGQLLNHLRSYLPSEEAVQNVLRNHQTALFEYIHTQMQAHFDPPEHKLSSKLGKDFSFLKPFNHIISNDLELMHFNSDIQNRSRISEYLFNGFKKSLYSAVRFDSDSERSFVQILEQDHDVLKWVRPPRDSLRLFYHRDRRYEPDFIVETSDSLFLCEIKSRAELDDPIVLQKSEVAIYWCELATNHAKEHNVKPWKYLLIPHNEVRLTTSFQGLVERFTLQGVK